MDKREFLKTSSVLLTGSILSPMIACETRTPGEARTNWAGNLSYSTANLHSPKSIAELQALVKSKKKLRGLGSRHSFNKIADSTENQVSFEYFSQVDQFDMEAGKVRVGAGVKYGQLSPYLHENGFALHNLASLPHISVVGACATATHGSGVGNGNLATAVSEIEFVTADGELVTLSKEKNEKEFAGAVVHLGGLGMVTKVRLDLQPTFEVQQYVYLDLPWKCWKAILMLS